MGVVWIPGVPDLRLCGGEYGRGMEMVEMEMRRNNPRFTTVTVTITVHTACNLPYP
jgi:hypothetical protein